MFNDDYTQMARERRDAHEDYIAEQTVMRSLVSNQPLRLTGAILLIVALLGFFFASGCVQPEVLAAEPEETAPKAISTQDLAGRYQVYDTAYPSFVEFSEDGTFRRAAAEGKLDSAAVDHGQWHMDGETLVMTSAQDVINCGEGRTGRYQISEYEIGGYMFRRLSEECTARTGFVPTAEMHPWQPAGLFCELDSGELCANK